MTRTALITGASRGIGKSIAMRLGRNGYQVILIARDGTQLKQVADAINDGKGQARYFCCDVANQEEVESVLRAAMEEVPKIDVLINCAGRSGGGKTAEMDDDLWRDIINTNLNSVYYVTKAVLNKGNMDENGAIINIASTGGKQGVPFGAAYSASKGGVIAFTKALGKELARTGITVNAVCPGYVETEMAQRVRKSSSQLWDMPVDEVKKKIEGTIPIGRYIDPEEVAGMVSYLASDQARGVTIQAINLCGGLGIY